MILFDTSVVIDARDPDSEFHEWAKQQIAEASSTAGAAVNSVVIAEASVRVEQREHFNRHWRTLALRCCRCRYPPRNPPPRPSRSILTG